MIPSNVLEFISSTTLYYFDFDFNGFTSQLTPLLQAKMYGYILLANTVVFAMWRIPRLLPFMQRYFLSSSCKGL